MMATKDNEYRKLALDSSNCLMDWDGQWGLGRYEMATEAVLHAGQMRQRMGQMSLKCNDSEAATEDWLSSAKCFVEATALKPAAEMLRLIQQLEAAGRIPPERQDLLAALREREEQVRRLERRIQEFFDRQPTPTQPDEQSLAALLRQVRELPGLSQLHRLIAQQASGLGRTELAAVHQHWAEVFSQDKAKNGPVERSLPPPIVDPNLASTAPKDR
jgi:hypothetical protein